MKRSGRSFFGALILNSTVISLIIGLGAGMILILMTTRQPAQAFSSFFLGTFSSSYFLGNWLTLAIPYMLTGLAATIGFSASAFNLGLEGQVYLGAFVGSWIALQSAALPPWLGIVAGMSVACLCGGLVAALSSWWKKTRGVSEMISSFMMSYIVIFVIDYVLEGPMRDPVSGLIATPFIPDGFDLGSIYPPSDLHAGLWIAIGCAWFVYLFLKHTPGGFAIRMVGKNPLFSKYGGISTHRALFWGMMISGGLAGLAGAVDLFGVHGRMIRGFSAGYGWNGIAIALIARNHPLLVIPSALLFAWLDSGAQVASLMSDLSPEIARMIQGIIFYGITAQSLFRWFQLRSRGQQV